MPRKIAVVTGTRAEYGLLSPTLRELQARGVELQLIVTGAHLSKAHGLTVSQIEADGFPIARRVDLALEGDTALDTALATARATEGMARAFAELKPDLVLLLGDRYEIMGTALAAALLQVPIAHIHGGEVTEGAIDESLRHAITKLAHWHFASAEPYARRLIQLGEEPERVFTVGAPGIDLLANIKLLSRAALAHELGMKLESPIILFTYHPETLSTQPVEKQIHEVLEALAALPEATLIATGANADAGGFAINAALAEIVATRENMCFRLSYGSKLYLSAMKLAEVTLGNSSSGVIETPTMGRATVNIGNRQKGRLRAPSVIDCACEKDAIVSAVRKALSPEFQHALIPSPLFGESGKVAPAIAEIIANHPLPASINKQFHDIG